MLAASLVMLDRLRLPSPSASSWRPRPFPRVTPRRCRSPRPPCERGCENRAPAVAPVPHVVQSILFGDPRWLARLNTSAAAVAPAGAVAWAHEWDALFASETVGSGFCTRTRPVMVGPATTLRAAVAGPFARSCAKTADSSADPPRRHAQLGRRALLRTVARGCTRKRRTYDPRLAAAARDVILTGRARSAKRRVHPHHAARPARACRAARHPFRDEEPCTSGRRRHAVLQFGQRGRPQAARRPYASAAGRIRGAGKSRCRSPTSPRCRIPQFPPLPSRRVVEQLRKIGFDKVGTLDAATVGSDAPELLLDGRGPTHTGSIARISSQPARLPDAKSRAARHADTGRCSLPRNAHPKTKGMRRRLTSLIAYASGKRYRLPAKNLGDWYDVDAVLRLMNAVMADRKSTRRAITKLATTDQFAHLRRCAACVMTRRSRRSAERRRTTAASRAGPLRTPDDSTCSSHAGCRQREVLPIFATADSLGSPVFLPSPQV